MSKVLLKPENMSRFCNFFIPSNDNSNSDQCNINFDEHAKHVNMRVTGLFGTKNDIKSHLLKLNFGSQKMFSVHCLLLLKYLIAHYVNVNIHGL